MLDSYQPDTNTLMVTSEPVCRAVVSLSLIVDPSCNQWDGCPGTRQFSSKGSTEVRRSDFWEDADLLNSTTYSSSSSAAVVAPPPPPPPSPTPPPPKHHLYHNHHHHHRDVVYVYKQRPKPKRTLTWTYLGLMFVRSVFKVLFKFFMWNVLQFV